MNVIGISLTRYRARQNVAVVVDDWEREPVHRHEFVHVLVDRLRRCRLNGWEGACARRTVFGEELHDHHLADCGVDPDCAPMSGRSWLVVSYQGCEMHVLERRHVPVKYKIQLSRDYLCPR
ncbi:MAG TPA: hypothetical protein VM580_34210 [Labilithrix sp.]|nr:hypothetical protein [Labilithrix sp.]